MNFFNQGNTLEKRWRS